MLRASDLWPLALLLLRSSPSSSPAAPSPAAPSVPSSARGVEVQRVRTGPPMPQWFHERFGLALEVLAPNVDGLLLRQIALSVVAQWSHETARGKSEFCFNLGGWRARRRDNYFVARDVQSGAETFRWTAYPDLPNAVHDQLKRLHDTFPTAWAMLVREPHTSAWVEELGKRGYYTASRDAYARAWASNRAELGGLVA